MIKKLDILIIRAFIGPFLATFLIALFVLVMQFFWLYIDDVVGKGLDGIIIFKLISMVTATLIPLALPLALLLSSIMTFGNLGETFELVAIKSAGISLFRFMRSLLIVSVLITIIAFVFANNIIPLAQLKLTALKHDIIVAKPAFDIKEGVFYDKLEGFIIKIGKKEKDDSTIRNVVIYEKMYGVQDNIMIAESGIMRVTPDKKYLEFKLRNGWRYQEKGQANTTNTEYIRLGFKEYIKIMNLTGFDLEGTSDSAYLREARMLSVRQLNIIIDSLKVNNNKFSDRYAGEVDPYLSFAKYADTGWVKTKVVDFKKAKTLGDIIPDSIKTSIYDRANTQVKAAKNSITTIADTYKSKEKILRQHQIEWHRKFSLSFACLVMFLIGAPLGSIIRKGGLGTPLIFAIIFFVIFHLLNTFGEKFVKEGVTGPFVGMWLSSLVLLPVSFFLIYKAMRDSQLFNQEAYYRVFKKIRGFLSNKKNKTA